MLTIYLDQNKWIDLRRAYVGRDDGKLFRETLELALSAREKGLASFPLSVAHYLETWKDRNEARRIDQARVMADLSRFDTILGPNRLFTYEIENALAKHLGRPEVPEPVEVFGRGYANAFATDRDIEVPDMSRIPPEIRSWLQDRLWSLKEFWFLGLVPVADGIELPGPEAFTKFASEFQKVEQLLAARIKEHSTTTDDREAVALIRNLADVFNLAAETCAKIGLRPEDIVSSLGKDGLKPFLEDIPSRHVNYEIDVLRYQDPNLPREKGDLFDMGALSVAIAYCDVVITERTWQHLAARSGVDQRYATRVISDLRELAPILRALGA
jgi:hypothetical protein